MIYIFLNRLSNNGKAANAQSELEKLFADIWNTGWLKYYEAFYGHEESEF